MELILAGIIVFVIVIILFVYFYGDKVSFKKSKTNDIKSQESKKESIVNQYEIQMRKIIEKYKDDNEELLRQKQLFLQKVNSEIVRNIYFDNSEIKKVIDRLLRL